MFPRSARNVGFALFAFLGACSSQSRQAEVKFETEAGDFVVALDADRAPQSVCAFLTIVGRGGFNGSEFAETFGSQSFGIEATQADAVQPIIVGDERAGITGMEISPGTCCCFRSLATI